MTPNPLSPQTPSRAALTDQVQKLTEQVRNLTEALVTSRRIGTAVGILMATHRITAEEAFQTLVRTSQRTELKLRDVADVVIGPASVTPETHSQRSRGSNETG